MPWTVKTGFKNFISPSLTVLANSQIDKTLERLDPGAKICDVGAGGRKITTDTFTIDGFTREGTDLVCDIHSIPLPDETFDCIFCTGTLEHVKNPQKVLNEICRLLKVDGIVHIEVPFIQGYHPDPDDYWRWTLNGLKLFCTDLELEELDSGVHIGPASATNWVVNSFVDCLFMPEIFRRVLGRLFRILISPIRYLDYFCIKNHNSFSIASAVYFIGKKRL